MRWLVLDEADRLLELGFEETLTEIIQILDTKARVCRTLPQTRDNCRVKAVCWPKERQTILCSATLSSDVKKLAETSLVEPIMIDEDTLKLQKQQLMHKEKEASKKAETLSSFAIEGKKNDVGVAVVATKNSVKQQLVDKQPSLSENKASSISTKSLDTKMDTKAVVTPALPTLIVSSSTPTELIEDEEEFMSIDTQQNKNGDNSDQEMDNQDSFNNIATRPAASKSSSKLQIPDQIKQSYLVVPAKLRLMALYSTLRHHAVSWKKSSDPSSTNMKIIVFMSSCDAVDFYHRLLTECGKRVFVREEGEEEQEDGIISEGKTPAVTKKDTALVYDSDSSGSDSDSEEGGTSKTTVTRTVKAKSSTTNNINNGDGPRSIVPYIPVLKLHGNLAQKDRMKMIREFTSANASILLCTDVAARGLDVPNVTHVIQYDPPTDINDYAHRVGRTARLGRAGEASIFFLPSEVEYLNTLASAGVDGLQPIKIENVVTWLSSDKELDDEAMAKWNNNFGAVATTASTSFDDAGLHNLLDFMKTFRKAGKMFTKRKNAEDLAMDVQMVMERYVLSTPEVIYFNKWVILY